MHYETSVPTVRDRLIQQAVMQVLQKRWDRTFSDYRYGFRPGRSAHQAVEAAQQHIAAGYRWVVDLDLEKFFDRVGHDKLQACLRMRIADRSVLKLIRQWLEAAVVEPSEASGGPPRISRRKQGTPQGEVISSLLANLYLHWFDKVFYRASGPAHWARAKLVRYADDFVVLARYLTPHLRGYIEAKLETWMGLEINREKTRVVNLSEKQAHLCGFFQARCPKGKGGKVSSRRPLMRRLARPRLGKSLSWAQPS